MRVSDGRIQGTIAELEQLMDAAGDREVTVHPDGTVTVEGRARKPAPDLDAEIRVSLGEIRAAMLEAGPGPCKRLEAEIQIGPDDSVKLRFVPAPSIETALRKERDEIREALSAMAYEREPGDTPLAAWGRCRLEAMRVVQNR